MNDLIGKYTDRVPLAQQIDRVLALNPTEKLFSQFEELLVTTSQLLQIDLK
jgi:hypothetical protein